MENLVEFVSRAHGLSQAEFRKKFPHPHLLLEETSAAVMPDTGFRTQDAFGAGLEPTPLPVFPSADGKVRDLIFAVGKGAGTPFPGMITVGRASNNDIVLKFKTISKFHAYFSKDPNIERYSLTDAGSTNGTLVNGKPLVEGKRVDLLDGDRVSFGGDLEMTFFMLDGLFPYLPVLARRFARART